MEHNQFSLRLLAWYAENGRQLPWRQTRDPYRIWVSEIILQQTRVAQGYDYFLRFVRRFPTVEALAGASEDEVLHEWQGLGYYSRARNLRAAARQVVELGHFPRTYDEIRRMKGVGDYTAAAIASLAFGLPHAVVDGNVYRVLSRYFGIDAPIDSTPGKRLFAALAQEMLVENRAADYNQAIMDFGAMQCTPQSPHCVDCPLADTCQALAEGRVTQLPVKQRATAVRPRFFTYVYVRYEGMTLLQRRGRGDIWQGLYQPPMWESEAAQSLDEVRQLLGEEGRLTLLRRDVRHQLSHQLLHADFYLWETERRPTLEGLWMSEGEVSHYAVPRLVEQLFSCLFVADGN
ncbi:MAG: A/G-specific adenine glycosylase [Bacteroidaceae bacterium]|nr:A/G-specific adenine glycosylase [Bacteroidaceae bacterium]